MLAAVVVATVVWYARDSSPAAVLAAVLIATFSLVPAWLWIRDGASDIPVFPVYAMTFLWSYALPLLGEQPYLEGVSPSSVLAVGGILSLGLVVGTVTWFWFRRGIPRGRQSALQLPVERMEGLLIVAAIANTAFYMGMAGAWFENIPSELLTVFRVFITSLYTLAVFVFFHEIGAGNVSFARKVLFLTLYVLSELASSITLVLVGTMLSALIALTAYSLGRSRVPWKTALAALIAFSVLHAGKGEMRDKYWFSNVIYEPQPTEYLSLYSEWLKEGVKSFTASDQPSAGNEQLSLRERAGLANIFLLVYESSPEQIPYLYGASYAPIPRLLVPRFIDPNRESTHEGTIVLNVRYGLQTRESAMSATIAWDLIDEAQANFGIVGVIIAFFLMGWLYALLERWCRGLSVFSFRAMVALMVLASAVQVGITLGVYITALFQAMVALTTLAVVAMERRQLRDFVSRIRPMLGGSIGRTR